MKKLMVLIVATLTFAQVNAQTAIFNDLLQEHVNTDGFVDYTSFNKEKLDSYLSYLEKTSPEVTWSENKQKAFWINAYNAYTIKKILENDPLISIVDIKENNKTAWKIPFAKVGGKTYTLDYIEHEILRKNLFDPRIHVGVNCASNSCPKLGNIAFTEENIEATLEKLMKVFINDSTKNKITENKIQISSIFDWFKEDFIKNGTVIEYLNTYSKTTINKKIAINYLKYDWSLNGK
jgi:predicted nucleic-acid-binding Zn-ribbon protein